MGAIALSLASLLAAAQACGGKSNSSAPADGGKGDAPVVDSGMAVDTGAAREGGEPTDAGMDTGPDCGTMPPTGKQVVASTDPVVVFTLMGSSTGPVYAVYENLTSQELYAASLAGGTPADIGKSTAQGSTVYAHGAVLFWLPAASNPNTSIATLNVWTPSGGNVSLSKSAYALDSYSYDYDVSDDGKYVAYYATTEADPRTGTLTLSAIDGTMQTPLASNIDLENVNCYPPMLNFVGSTLIAQYCPEMDDAAAETTTVATFTAPSFQAVTLGTAFGPPEGPIAVDPTGKYALMVAGTGTGLSLYPLAGGNPLTVDPTGVGGTFTATGDILYTTTSTSLNRYSAKTATTMTLVSTGLNYLLYLSPDGNWLQAAANVNATTGLLDLYLASTTKPGPAIPVVTTLTTGPLSFTADSKYSLFETNVPMDFGTKPYTLNDSKTTGGAPTKLLQAATSPWATSGSKIIVNGPESSSTGAADILSLDLSTTTGPTTLVSQADPNLFLASSTELVYSWYCDANASAGIWTLTPP